MIILISNITDSGILRVRSEIIKSYLSYGHTIVVVSPESGSHLELEKMGCRFISIKIEAHGMNPIKDMLVIKQYHSILKIIKPDLVLTFTIKPNLYCGISCRMMKITQVMNITGLGMALAYPSLKQSVLVLLYRIVAKDIKTIFFQNSSNLNQFRNWKIASDKQYRLLPGSGVNLNKFVVSQYPEDTNGIHFLFVSRILKAKGIDNYIEAARVIKEKYPNTYFHVLGNMTEKYQHIIDRANKSGFIIYHGRVDNVANYQKMSHCTVLPSYYPEGICNVLLEAAASGRPIITCNNPGCSETVDDGRTGYLVEPNNTLDLISKMELFLSLSNEERAQMGMMGRRKMEKEFDRQKVVKAYMEMLK